ncbi:uncharacterized protein LOC128683420 isoform X2 [Plodia interpunctella]|nr:uncharacterized protein LOC128683420 isoform X2 [Plodia interpunctella]
MADEVPNSLKQRFKGVENFLRRIAFNLGNSPSQTEVKIISCIPIDVTDLQQKICDLERVVTRLHKPPAIVHTALCEPTRCEAEPPAFQERELQQTNLPESPACDNILKDVKYLSEKKPSVLKISNNAREFSTLTPVPNTTVIDNIAEKNRGNTISSSLITFLNGNNEKNNIIKNNFSKKLRRKLEKRRNSKPKSHLVFYAQTDDSPFKIHNQVEKRATNVVDKKLGKSKKEKKTTKLYTNNYYLSDMVRQYEPLMHQLSGATYVESDFSSPICRDIEYNCSTAAYGSDLCSCCHKDFVNIDNGEVSQEFGFSSKFQEQINSQNMYYDSSLYDLVPVKEAPVKPKKMTAPVKEALIKPKKNLELYKTKKNQRYEIDFSHYMDHYGDRPYDRSMYVNYNTLAPAPRVVQTTPRTKAPTRKTCRRKPVTRRISIYNDDIGEATSYSCRIECGDVYKKTTCIPEPSKKTEERKKTVTYNDAETATINNTECQTVTTIQNVENDSIPSDDKTEITLNQIKSILQSVLTEVKTNSKLNKPKVGVEVKLKKDAVIQNGTSFGTMPGSSRLLNSFSYGAYNTGPYGASCSHPINSGQQWSGVPFPPRCMHNYPVFIQSPGRLPYGACFKNTPHVIKQSAHTACRASAATNTNHERRDDHNYETDTLIKEIYKSIALNIDMPKKDTSTSNCSSVWKQRSSRTSTKSSFKHDKTARQVFPLGPPSHVSNGRHANNPVTFSQLGSNSQISRKRDGRSSVQSTPYSSNTFNNKLTSNSLTVQSNTMSSTNEGRMKSNRHYLDTTQELPSENEIEIREPKKKVVVSDRRPPTTSTGVTAETAEEESDGSVQTILPDEAINEKKKGANLFSKMIQSVKLFKNRRRRSQKSKIDSEEEESDSDDYQTIYSQQVQQPRRPLIQIHVPPRKLPHSKVSYSRQMRGRNQEKQRRSPMEQEYRRQWNERLMYQRRPPRSTDQSERSYKGSQR